MKILESLVRTYVGPNQLQVTIDFYERLFNRPCHLLFPYPKYHLELAAVGSVLIISGEKKHLRQFEATTMTYHVDDLQAFRELLISKGAIILDEPKNVPTGVNMLVRHPDGLIIEYVEHRSNEP